MFNWGSTQKVLPIKTFGISKTTPPRGIEVADIVYAHLFTLACFGILLAGWHFSFSVPNRANSLADLQLDTIRLIAILPHCHSIWNSDGEQTGESVIR